MRIRLDVREYGPSLFLIFSVLLLVIIVSFGVTRRQVFRGRARVAQTFGHANMVSAHLYGTAALATAGSGENTTVQDVPTPSIAGFTTDLFTGNAAVDYPLDIPKGRGGLTPTVGLGYSSAAVYDPLIGADFDGDGDHDSQDVEKWKNNLYVASSQIGLGWSLGGLESIYRDQDNRYTLVLSGRSYRLFKKYGEFWRTEPESFLRIRHQVVANEEPAGEVLPNEECTSNDYGGEKLCAKQFEIWDKSGTKYTFSPWGYFWKRCDERGADGTCEWLNVPWDQEGWAASYNRWVLNRVTDVHGNEIDILYTADKRQLGCSYMDYWYPTAVYPEEINYSGAFVDGDTVDAGFKSKIDFVYADRDDYQNLEGLDNGCAQVFYSQKRLARIDVKVREPVGSWKTVRQYELNNNQYFTKPGSDKKLHLRLGSITARGRDDDGDGVGDAALPAYTFSYFDEANDLHTFRLLSAAENGYGGRVNYEYEMYPTPDFNPETGTYRGEVSETHRVTAKKAFDGLGNFYQTTYAYRSPRGISQSDRHKGFEFAGHEAVTATAFAKNSTDSIVNATTTTFAQGDIEEGKFFPVAERGRPTRIEVKDGGGKLLSFSESEYLREPFDHDWETSHFVATRQERACTDPESPWPKGTKTTYHYLPERQGGEQWGNLTHTTEYLVNDCNFADASAYRMTQNSYRINPEKHLTGLVEGAHTYACNSDQSGSMANLVDCPQPQRIGLTWYTYDGDHTKTWQTPQKGLLTLKRDWYEFPSAVKEGATEFNNGTWRVVDSVFDYDNYGNLTTTKTYDDYGQIQAGWTFSPPGNGSREIRSTSEYEPTYQTFVKKTTNPLGHSAVTTALYNGGEVDHPYLADEVRRQNQNDLNNNLYTKVIRDNLGRTRQVFAPGETAASEIIEYRDAAPFTVHRQTRDDPDDGTAPSYFHSWQIYNGLGQLIQTQTEREGDGAKITLAATSYNALGQPDRQLTPYDPGTAGGGLITPDWSLPKTTFAYDAQGRVVEEVLPGGRVSRTGYFGRKTAALDPNNHLSVSEVDGLGRLKRVEQFEGQRELGPSLPEDSYTHTSFTYDSLDRLTSTTNFFGQEVSTTNYNQFGQKVLSDDLDLGERHYTYYPNGNLASVLDARNQKISYQYDDLGRLTAKYYGDLSSEPVATFTFDDCPNGVGRRCSDSTANRPADGFIGVSNAYAYDPRGRLIEHREQIEGVNYTTGYEYDAANRIRTVIYPGDGERVGYAYNAAGQLLSVSGDQSYLSSATYNPLGLPVEEVLGNGAKNIYGYEDNTHRLRSIDVQDSGGQRLWSQSLEYDPVGDVSEISYAGSQIVDKVLSFGYDALDRLTGIRTLGEPAEKLSGEYVYDQLGRMSLKREEVLATETLEGDVNNDCRVDIFDLVLIARVYGVEEGEPDFDPALDLSGNGRIDIFDLVQVARNYGVECGG